jgi:hypothetical protein
MKLEFVPRNKFTVLKVVEGEQIKFGLPMEIENLPWWHTASEEKSTDGKVRFKFHDGSFYIYASDIDFDWTK